ncbi:hypothetical protein [Saccharothrix variisporea]|uniref:Secreted protein n=1 Tax=Saccharothrix variisporea TaxID=543527 RepID=A0A495XPW7_9PSEU|nr:hypothetical protein [Saccharothrix variisporea]RKT74954.1 hypothetical protein DFJ66_8329 [Saccharothrix variisporea]
MALPTRDPRSTTPPVARSRAIPPRFASLRRPPGPLIALAAVLALLCLVSGLLGALDVQHRRAALDDVLQRGGPLTGAALESYQSISDADATAAGAFLVGDVEPPQSRDRYRTNIAEASAALGTAASGAAGGGSAAAITRISTHLPVYTGIIETARALNRRGLPQGASYLREASALAHTIMLPAAEELLRQENARLAAAQDDAAAVGWVALGAGVLALAALVAAQVHLARGTRRIFNRGLLAATACVLAAVTWLAIASFSAASHGAAARESTGQVEAFANARVMALQARADESLALVARGNGRPYELAYADKAGKLNGEQGLFAVATNAAGDTTRPAVDKAVQAWRQWQDHHRDLRTADDSGDYNLAVRLATGADPKGTAEPSTVVDQELAAAIGVATERFEAESRSARDAVAGGELVVAVLMGLAALAVGFGFAPRIREFR